MGRVCVVVRLTVTVNCDRTTQAMLDATGRYQLVNPQIVAEMPKGTGGKKEVTLFSVEHLSDAGLNLEFKARGLVAVDPFTLAAVNEAEPDLGDEFPNITHWQDAGGKWCYAFFHKNAMLRRSVYICQSDGSYKGVWAAGVAVGT